MKLTELNPRWIADHGAPAGVRQGITFLCPCCKTTRLGVWFDHGFNIDAFNSKRFEDGHVEHEAYEAHMGEKHWNRTGETFETLSLTPSIDASKFGHWHGFVTNGEVS